MIRIIGDNIYSPLGTTTEGNLQALLAGVSRLKSHAHVHGQELVEPFVGSVFEDLPSVEGYTSFESLCILSAKQAIAEAQQREKAFDATQPDCIFVLSSTKGNIWSSMAESARKIAQYFGNQTVPVVISTACTSGVSAQIVAHRLLSSGQYKSAVVMGCDVQSEFIVSGFQSFKALSDEPCKPYDAARKGLNAGEAAATMVLLSSADEQSGWTLLGGSIHNDANHISGPSRTAEGSWRCLEDTLELVEKEELACVSVHGTGTNYNDEMEAIAIHRAGLDEVPISALKGYYGHTMGAAGLMETILTIHALEQGIVLPSRGFDTCGTTYPVSISNQVRHTEKQSFIKLLSGFGGVNAAVAWRKEQVLSNEDVQFAKRETAGLEKDRESTPLQIIGEVKLTEKDDLVALYRAHIGNYPKFFKMDTLSRLGIVAVELLKQQLIEQGVLQAGERAQNGGAFDAESTAIILANRSASLQNDTAYQVTIEDKNNYFPSPALFVYTLPNIVTGELAIRHHLYGETAFYVLNSEDELMPLVEATMRQSKMQSAIVGWLECKAKDDYTAHARYVKIEN